MYCGVYDGLDGFACVIPYRQVVVDSWRTQPGKSGLTNLEAFTEIVEASLRGAGHTIIDGGDCVSVYELPGATFNHTTEEFTLDNDAIEANADVLIAEYLTAFCSATIGDEIDTDLLDDILTEPQTLYLREAQLVARFSEAISWNLGLESGYIELKACAAEWLLITTPVIADLNAMPEFKEYVIYDNDTDAESVTVENATDSADRLESATDGFFAYAFALSGFRDCMARAITAAADKAALIAIDTTEILTLAEAKLP